MSMVESENRFGGMSRCLVPLRSPPLDFAKNDEVALFLLEIAPLPNEKTALEPSCPRLPPPNI